MTIQSWGRPRCPASIGTHAHASRSPKLHADKSKPSEDSSLKSRIRGKNLVHQCRRHQSLMHSAFRKISQTSRRRSLTYVAFGEIQGKPNRAFGLNKQTYMVAHSHTACRPQPAACEELERTHGMAGDTATGHSASAWLSTWRVWMAMAPVRGR